MRLLLAPRRVFLFLTFLLGAALLGGPAVAQDISINLGGNNGGVTERAIQLIALLTILSLAPSIVVMMTSFTRIVVVLSHRAGHRDRAAECDDRVACALPHRLGNGACPAERLRHRHQAARRQSDYRRAASVRPERRKSAENRISLSHSLHK